MHLAQRVRAARDDDHDDRRAGGQKLVEQIGLHPGQPEVLGVAALARGAAAEQPGEVADEGDAQVGLPGRGDGRGEARTGRPRWTSQPGSWTISTSGSSARSASSALGTSIPSPRSGWRGSTWLGNE